jgi:hypothetical protein
MTIAGLISKGTQKSISIAALPVSKRFEMADRSRSSSASPVVEETAEAKATSEN